MHFATSHKVAGNHVPVTARPQNITFNLLSPNHLVCTAFLTIFGDWSSVLTHISPLHYYNFCAYSSNKLSHYLFVIVYTK